ncbi:MAG: Na+/H+ antiporter [Rhodospirillales bacterium]|nr:Na+/H+ antiporter [Rhodospirillales bacterium]
MEIFEATLALLSMALILSVVAGRLRVPYPSFLVIGGLAIGFLPIAPGVALEPRLVFTLFLPPVLFAAAYSTSWRDFRDNIRPIAALAIVLVAVTTYVVAIVAHYLIPELPIQAAFVLGAIISPPDAAAATAVLSRMKLPGRIVTIVEGESLVNDAIALVLYNFAVRLTVAGTFSVTEAGLSLAISVLGSLALGIVIGVVWTRLAERLSDPLISIAASFIVAFATYLAAEALHVSGVLAVVTVGLVFAWRAPTSLTAEVRLGAAPVWGLVIFTLNALAFVLIGLQLPGIVADLPDYSLVTLDIDAALIALTAIVVRLVWVVGLSQLLRMLGGEQGRRKIVDWREAVVIGWSGMRGLVSLAAALALPETIDGGAPFPARAIILFVAFAVILATLVVQGLTLSGLVQLVRIENDGSAEREEKLARAEAAVAAIATIDKLAETPALPQEVLDRLRLLYFARLQQASGDQTEGSHNPTNADFLDAVRLAAIGSERSAILRLRHKKVIGDGPLHKIQRELDLAEASVKRGRPESSMTSWLDPARYVDKSDDQDQAANAR